MMRKTVGMALVSLVIAGAMAGCRAEDTQARDACGADALQSLVGQPAAVFDAQTREGPVRVIPHDGAATMDYVPERLNISLDESGDITRIWCG